MFDGKVRGNRAVSSAGKKREPDKEAFLENTRRQREDRATERKKLIAVVKLQALFRRFNARKHVCTKFKNEMDKKISEIRTLESAFTSRGRHFNVPLDVLLPIFRSFLFTFDGDGFRLASFADAERLKRTTSILLLFLDSLRITASNQVNPVVLAIAEVNSSADKVWLSQVLQLSRLAVLLIHSYSQIESSARSDELFAANQIVLKNAVELAIRVLDILLHWPTDIVPHAINQQMMNVPTVEIIRTAKTDTSIIMKEAIDTSNGGKSGVETFLTCVSRFIAHSCAITLRGCVLLVKKSANDSGVIAKASGYLMSFIQTAIMPLEIPREKRMKCRDRNYAMTVISEEILTMPQLKNYSKILSPLLVKLSEDGGAGWVRALKGVCTAGTDMGPGSTPISTNANLNANLNANSAGNFSAGGIIDEKFLRKIHYLNNFCSCSFALPSSNNLDHLNRGNLRMLVTSEYSAERSSESSDSGNGVTWISGVSDVLQSMPLVMILNRMQGKDYEKEDDNKYGKQGQGTSSTSASTNYETNEENDENKDNDENEKSATQVVNENDEGENVTLFDSSISEQTIALAGGVKRLEYRITNVLKRAADNQTDSVRAFNRNEINGDNIGSVRNEGTNDVTAIYGRKATPSIISSLITKLNKKIPSEKEEGKNQQKNINLSAALTATENIVRFLTTNTVISSLTDSVTTSNMKRIGNIFSVIKIYSKILIYSPSISDSLASNLPLSISILNTMAYGKPNDPLSKRLWDLLSTFDTSVLSEAMNRGGSNSVPTPYTPPVPTPIVSFFGSAVSPSSTPYTAPYSLCTTQTANKLGISCSALCDGLYSTLYLFCCVMSHQMTATDDEEFFNTIPMGSKKMGGNGGGEYNPVCVRKMLPISELKSLVVLLKSALFNLYCAHPSVDQLDANYAPSLSLLSSTSSSLIVLTELQTRIAVTRLFNQLYTRNERRSFLEESSWHLRGIPRLDAAAVSDIMLNSDQSDGGRGMDDYNTGSRSETLQHVRTLLSCIPQVVPFEQRVDVFQALLRADKAHFFQTDGAGGMMASIGMGGSVQVKINRETLVEDAFTGLRFAGRRLKGRVQVEFIGEAGIDGGGLFKEFVDSFLKAAFDPNLGLFCPTSAQLLVPNPYSLVSSASLATTVSNREGLEAYAVDENGNLRRTGGHSHLTLFHFLGQMLGKALYESILVEPQFSSVFLNLLLGRSNQLDDLLHLDAPMHRSLMTMKHAAAQGEDVSSWGIGFEIDSVRDGVTVTEELVVDGQPVVVTKDNVHAFIHRKANYKLNIETAEQSRAFLVGFREMIPVDWIRMFSSKELQLLISGDQRPIDIADMRKHVNYGGGYHDSQPYIQAFWDIVSEMTSEEQGELLHFVTSCPRQPLRGFGQLNPLICVQRVSPYSQSTTEPSSAARLPSAATCMNLLKLPQYDTIQQLKEKLLYAIKSHSGFELS